jgi:hypothetical protein
MRTKTLMTGLLTGAFLASGASAHPGDDPAAALVGLLDPLHPHTHFGEAAMAAILLIGCGLILYAAVRRWKKKP